jgi:hypothetical protein
LLQRKIDATLHSASVVESTTSVTAKQNEQMDERLAHLQLLVKASIDTKHHLSDSTTKAPKQRRKPRVCLYAITMRLELVGCDKHPKQTREAQSICQYIMNLVDTAVLVREHRGKRTYQLVAGPDRDFTALSLGQKKAMVQDLQSLRLLLWLLRSDNYLATANHRTTHKVCSALAREASVHSLAAFSVSFSALDVALSVGSLVLKDALPWVRWKPWLQYLFDRMKDKNEDGPRVMEMVLKQMVMNACPRSQRPFSSSSVARLYGTFRTIFV